MSPTSSWGRVVAVVVRALDAEVGVGRLSHVGQEVLEAVLPAPAFADPDATASVEMVVIACLGVAPLEHGLVDGVEPDLAQTMWLIPPLSASG